jgi:hypothetical protein
MASKANSLADGAFAFIKYSADTSDDNAAGTVEVGLGHFLPRYLQ